MHVKGLAAGLLAGVLASTASAIQSAQVAAPAPVDDQDSYAVYAAILPNEWPVRVAKAKALVVQKETVTFSYCLPSGPPMETDWRDVLDDYRRQNSSPRTLVAGRPLGIPYVVMPLAEFKAVMTWNAAEPSVVGWMLWYRRFPDSGGFISASAVGFNRTKQRALVYMGHSCNDLCGGGTYHLLEKRAGAWREVRPDGLKSCSWAS